MHSYHRYVTGGVMVNNARTILIAGEDRQGDVPLHSILQEEYKVIWTLSGSEALNIIDELLPDLIVVNAVIRDTNQFDLISKLIGHNGSSHIPVIMNAELSDFADCENLLSYGADIITAPIQPEIVKMRVRLHLELKQYREAQKKSSMTDPLLGIANRRFLEDMLRREWRRAMRHQAPQSLILAEIDYFNAYLECYGRSAGNECLGQILAAISKCVKREVDCVARFEEDVFACLLTETDINGAAHVASHVFDAVDELNIPHAGSPVADHVTLSIGLATLKPTSKVSPEKLIHQAEQLLVEAKQNGHNQVRSRQK